MNEFIRIAPTIYDALQSGAAVVALETTLVSHGFPHPVGAEVALESEARVRRVGAVPATIGVFDGVVCVGLDEAQIERLGTERERVRKVGPRDLATCVAQSATGGTTVGGTVAIASSCGIRFMATGGIGGVHRGFPYPPDISADLGELARSAVMVISAGIKSLLDVPATVEVLEALGIPLIGWRTNHLPLFFSADGGPTVPARVDSAEEAARVAATHWKLGRATGLLLARPPSRSVVHVEKLIDEAVAAASSAGVTGQGITPYVLAFIHARTGGVSAEVNKELIIDNAALAAEVALAFSDAR